MAQSGRRLTARPVESEQPGAEINYFQSNNVCENSLFKSSGLMVVVREPHIIFRIFIE
jgi:hypothetical protein